MPETRPPASKNLVTTDWLAARLGEPEISIVDGSFYLPALKRNAKEEYLAGHIPGAVSAPWIENLDSDARFKPKAELRKHYEKLGVDPDQVAVVYCGSGVNSCHDLLALELAGFENVKLYAGSWSDWASRDAPVATGSEPGGKA